MKLKKISLLGLSLLLSLSVVACTKKTQEKVGEDVNNANNNVEEKVGDYTNYYSSAYNKYSTGMDKYSMYNTVADVNKVYETKEYPGNEKYLQEVKAAYKDSRDKTQEFVDSLKKDNKTDDKELGDMHEKLIAEGERTIKEMDSRIKRLDEISDEDMKRDQNGFITLVHGITHTGNDVQNGFNNMINDMNKRLGITR
ncbi:hypothetical protein KQI18_01215 [Clostridioides mangenotii]|uniref:hypothetical protein n=1 Tax=Metaclostridioides mangenotii TaxID=1540 RepID=UPI001C1157AB|nr:hypothetical protein [Clostridioides mangenotii]MBU5306393.1 hypothetical protein [Clostridioides mangenotii]